MDGEKIKLHAHRSPQGLGDRVDEVSPPVQHWQERQTASLQSGLTTTVDTATMSTAKSTMPLTASTTTGNHTRNILRVDGPQGLAGPKLHWSVSVSYLDDLSTSLASLMSLPTVGKAPSELKQSAPNADRRPNSTATEGASRRREYLDLVAEAAHDVRSPIACASQILTAITRRLRGEMQAEGQTLGNVSAGELQLLEIANMRLTEANSWAEGILLGRSLLYGRPAVVRSRFYPGQWQQIFRPLAESIAAQHNVSLNWEGWDRSLSRVYLDADHLSRAVLNLTVNAIQASQAGQTVTLRAFAPSMQQDELRIELLDQGPGLSPDLMEVINSSGIAWNQRDHSSYRGMGLRTARALILGMGGTITVDRRPQGGARFQIGLPTDQPTSILRHWLCQNANYSVRPIDDQLICMFAIRSTLEDTDFVDSQLQQAATSRDLVVRVGLDRWIWLALGTSNAEPHILNSVLRRLNDVSGSESPNMLCQRVYAGNRFTSSDLNNFANGGDNITNEVAKLVTRVEQMMGSTPPMIDDLTVRKHTIVVHPSASVGRSRLISSSARRAQSHTEMHRADAISREAPISKSAREKMPPANLAVALKEIAEHWKITNQHLQEAHASGLAKQRTTRGNPREHSPTPEAPTPKLWSHISTSRAAMP